VYKITNQYALCNRESWAQQHSLLEPFSWPDSAACKASIRPLLQRGFCMDLPALTAELQVTMNLSAKWSCCGETVSCWSTSYTNNYCWWGLAFQLDPSCTSLGPKLLCVGEWHFFVSPPKSAFAHSITDLPCAMALGRGVKLGIV
jgi:hypothetical protein